MWSVDAGGAGTGAGYEHWNIGTCVSTLDENYY